MRKTRAPAPRWTEIPVSWNAVPLVIDVSTAAALLQVSEHFIRVALEEGRLPGGKIGREWRIDRDKLREMIGGL